MTAGATSPGRSYALALLLMAGGLVGVILAFGLPWLAVAAVVGVIATRGWVRRLIGALLAIAGTATAAVGLLTGEAAVPAVVGGLVLATGALWTALRGQEWPVMGARYEPTAGERRRARAVSDWDALDQGRDPTDEDRPSG